MTVTRRVVAGVLVVGSVVGASVAAFTLGVGAVSGAPGQPPPSSEVVPAWLPVAGESPDAPFGYVANETLTGSSSGPIEVYGEDRTTVIGYLVPDVGVLGVDEYEHHLAEGDGE